ncbi:GNAT family N-acetyltransferase, partial [Chloroflexota bacterium]
MADDTMATYPARYETEVLLKDGSRILLRPIKREDTELWLTFFRRLSQQHTRYLRLHHMTEKVDPEDALRFCTVDYNNTFAFVAEVFKKDGKDIVAIGRYYRLPSKHSAIVTLAVEDTYRGKGIGTHLIEWLAKVARDNGITTFEADAFAENEQIMSVLRDYGFRFISEQKAGMYHITIPLTQSHRITAKEEERERLSTLTSIRHILSPRSIAVIGASRQPGSIGQIILKAIVENGFTGVVYPVNPKADQVMAIKAYPSILDVPGDVDMGVIVVPTQLVASVAKDCGLKGVHALVVISDGFKERGPEGAAREEELRDITLGHGMRLVGPNCMGVINTSPSVKMNASFSPTYPSAGNVAFLSQSGAMGVVILEYASSLNMGISSFVSVGNRADISSNDLLSYWEQDPATKVILLYLESFGNPRKFSRTAQRVAAKKPIIVVKSGTTPAGSRAASSHTGSLATSDVVSDALFHQAGIIRVDSMQELFDVASLLSSQPLPKGRKLAILTNGGGPGIIAADASIQHGLQIPELSPKAREELGQVVKRDISLNNPLDLTGSFTREEFEGAMKILAQDNDIDAVLALFVPAVASNAEVVENSIRKIIPLYRQHKKPLLVCFMGQKRIKTKPGTTEKSASFFTFPENAVSALAKAAEYRELIQKPKGTIPGIRNIKHTRA